MKPPVNNPFTHRGRITDPAEMFNRERDWKDLRFDLTRGKSCQVVGSFGVGKSSLLYNLKAFAREWDKAFDVAYVDLREPLCHTVLGFVETVWSAWEDSSSPTSMKALAERIGDWHEHGRRPVLCLDNFEEFSGHRREFGVYFFFDLRDLTYQGLCFVTASEEMLGKHIWMHDPNLPFFHHFPSLRIGLFRDNEPEDFVNLHRPGVPPFTPKEKAAILKFAVADSIVTKPNAHPLALQVACFHVLEAKANDEPLIDAMGAATDEMKTLLPIWEPI